MTQKSHGNDLLIVAILSLALWAVILVFAFVAFGA